VRVDDAGNDRPSFEIDPPGAPGCDPVPDTHRRQARDSHLSNAVP
jgi:hypothetical protein